VHLNRDGEVLTSWNGLTLATLAGANPTSDCDDRPNAAECNTRFQLAKSLNSSPAYRTQVVISWPQRGEYKELERFALLMYNPRRQLVSSGLL
jgi:uncharacterized protein YyaL (SSP411 family)